jgi:hypothetical protein
MTAVQEDQGQLKAKDKGKGEMGQGQVSCPRATNIFSKKLVWIL